MPCHALPGHGAPRRPRAPGIPGRHSQGKGLVTRNALSASVQLAGVGAEQAEELELDLALDFQKLDLDLDLDLNLDSCDGGSWTVGGGACTVDCGL